MKSLPPVIGMDMHLFLGAIVLVNCVILFLAPVHLNVAASAVVLAPALFFVFGAYLLRRLSAKYPEPAPLLVLSGQVFVILSFMYIANVNFRLFNHLSMLLPFPYADAMLARWDEAIGLDWLAYFKAVNSRPWAVSLLDYSYALLDLASVLAPMIFLLIGRHRNAAFIIRAYFLTALFCAVVGAAFPAKAAVITLAGGVENYDGLPRYTGVYHMAHLAALRDPGTPAVISLDSLPGLITFPSFHAAAGVLLVIAFWNTSLRLPAALYSALMMASAPVFGGHYFVDLIFGGLVAVVIAWAVRRKLIALSGPE